MSRPATTPNAVFAKRRQLQRRRQRLREWYLDLKASMKCNDCGFSHPAVIQLHHISGKKTKNLSSLKGASKARVLEEMSKCIPLCANCHAIRHYNEGYAEIRAASTLANPAFASQAASPELPWMENFLTRHQPDET